LKDIIKTREEINEMDIIGTVQRVNETKSSIFEKISKVDRQINQKKEGEDKI
jgi:hypothetical protein